jgi:drug/metabolite transporter (DMT)-like permease
MTTLALTQILSYMHGIERMSTLKAFGVVLAVGGAMWVEISSLASSASGSAGKRGGCVKHELRCSALKSACVRLACALLANV